MWMVAHAAVSIGAMSVLMFATGVFQSGGWPSNVATMGVWFGKEGRGVILGLWNCHTFMGNIIGKAVATAALVTATYDYTKFHGAIPMVDAPGHDCPSSFKHAAKKHQWSTTMPYQKGFQAETCSWFTGVFGNCKAASSPKWGPDHKIFHNLTMQEAQEFCDKIEKCKAYVHHPFVGGTTSPGVNITDSIILNVSFHNSTGNLYTAKDLVAWNQSAPAGSADSGLIAYGSEAKPKAKAQTVCTTDKFCTIQKKFPWGNSFFANGGCIFGGGLIILLFLVPHPRDVGLKSESEEETMKQKAADPEGTGPMQESLLGNNGGEEVKSGGISPLQALLIPGVIEFSICFFFTKFVVYSFLFWLPKFLELGKYNLSAASYMATWFDIGGMFGGMFCGFVSDMLDRRAIVAASGCLLAIPSLWVYYHVGSHNDWVNRGLLFLCGFWIQGVYALITTAVSADLGTSKHLKGNAHALAMVTAIIDGSGSIGAIFSAKGPTWIMCLSINPHSDPKGLNGLFLTFEIMLLISATMLTRLVIKEIRSWLHPVKTGSGIQQAGK
jgi:sugar phosphate permease